MKKLPPWADEAVVFSACLQGLHEAVQAGTGDVERLLARRCWYRTVDALRQADTLSRGRRAAQRTLAGGRERALKKLGREPDDHDVCRELGLGFERYRQLADFAALDFVSLDESRACNHSLHDVLAVEPEDVAEHELARDLARALDDLTPRERAVVTTIYYHGWQLKQVAEVLQISPERVCQIKRQAVNRMRAALKAA